MDATARAAAAATSKNWHELDELARRDTDAAVRAGPRQKARPEAAFDWDRRAFLQLRTPHADPMGVTVAHQTAMPTPARRTRPHPMVLVAAPNPHRAVGKLAGLIMLTALGASLAAAAVGLTFLLVLVNVSG